MKKTKAKIEWNTFGNIAGLGMSALAGVGAFGSWIGAISGFVLGIVIIFYIESQRQMTK